MRSRCPPVSPTLKAPFPWFGGKARIAAQIWARLGDVPSYVEPFFGSGAVLLARPHAPRIETVNDADGMVANFWRAVGAAGDEFARHADWPVNEADLHARHLWLIGQRERLTERLMADPDFFDAKAAGWWAWGASCWIGSGWCSGKGPWGVVDGVFTHLGDTGVKRQMPHLGDAGRGVNRQMPHLANAGQGVNRQMPHLGNAGQGAFAELQQRLRRVRVVCGDWSRVLGDCVLFPSGALCGVVLDPPYRSENSIEYAAGGAMDHAALEAWCRENGERRELRIALCGYEGEYDLPGWSVVPWKAAGGYGSQGDGLGRENSAKERVWFSPHCLPEHKARDLFDFAEASP